MAIAPIRRVACAAAVALALAPWAITVAQESTPAPTASAERNAVALGALDRMGQALRALKSYSLTSDTSLDVVLDNGQKVALDGQVAYKVQHPDKLFVDLQSDRKSRQIFYDGRQLTIYSPRLKYYAHAETRARSLGDLVLNASRDYGIEFPLSDMFFWGTPYNQKEEIQSDIYVGAGKLDAEVVDHYAYRQPGVDWQVWISKETSLPKKLLITSLDDPAMPQYEARLHWDLKTPVAAESFRFAPPSDARRIEVVPVQLAATGTQEQ